MVAPELQPEIIEFPYTPPQPTPSLAKKMALVMSKLQRIEKNGKHPHHGYPYATSDDIFQAVRAAMAEANLAVFPDMISWRQEPVGKQVRTYGVFEFTFICGETGESRTCRWEAEADDTQDKGINKVATAALKNFLLKAFVMSTGDEAEDTEANPTPGELPMTREVFIAEMGKLGYGSETAIADVLKALNLRSITGLKKYEFMLDTVKSYKAQVIEIKPMDQPPDHSEPAQDVSEGKKTRPTPQSEGEKPPVQPPPNVDPETGEITDALEGVMATAWDLLRKAAPGTSKDDFVLALKRLRDLENIEGKTAEYIKTRTREIIKVGAHKQPDAGEA